MRLGQSYAPALPLRLPQSTRSPFDGKRISDKGRVQFRVVKTASRTERSIFQTPWATPVVTRASPIADLRLRLELLQMAHSVHFPGSFSFHTDLSPTVRTDIGPRPRAWTRQVISGQAYLSRAYFVLARASLHPIGYLGIQNGAHWAELTASSRVHVRLKG